MTAELTVLHDHLRALADGPRDGDYNLSVERGTAGVAYAALLLARRFADPALAHEAYRLLAGDARVADRPPSFAMEPGIRHAEDVRAFFERSVIYGEPGFRLVLALASDAAGDAATAAEAADAFAALIAEEYSFGEFQFGSAGALWGCALLLESSLQGRVRDRIAARARTLLAACQRQYEADDETRSLFALGEYGFAHGRAGILFAILRASVALGIAPPAGTSAALERLALRAEVGPRGVSWPVCDRPIPALTAGVAESWCNGATGFVPLWSLAFRVYHHDVFRQLAIKTAYFVASSPTGAKRGLCCGWAGHLCAFREAQALDGSQSWAAFSAPVREYLRESQSALTLETHGLLKGEAGIMLDGTAWL